MGKVIGSAKEDLAVLEPVLKEKSAATEILLKTVSTPIFYEKGIIVNFLVVYSSRILQHYW